MLRNQFRSRTWTTRIIIIIVTVSSLLSLWKPATSRVDGTIDPTGLTSICTSIDGHEVFIVDTLYAASISILPAVLLLVFNAIISRRLFVWRRSQEMVSRTTRTPIIKTNIPPLRDGKGESYGQRSRIMGVQFAVVLLSVSIVSLLLTWPYYICWIVQWRRVFQQITNHSLEIGRRTGRSGSLFESTGGFYTAMYVTRVLFYLNYSVNFFLYNLTGRFFRSELKRIIWSATVREQPSDADFRRQDQLPMSNITNANLDNRILTGTNRSEACLQLVTK